MSQKKTGLLRLVQEPHHNSTFINDIWQRGLLFSYLLIMCEKFDIGQELSALFFFIETVSPLQTTAKCEQIKWC